MFMVWLIAFIGNLYFILYIFLKRKYNEVKVILVETKESFIILEFCYNNYLFYNHFCIFVIYFNSSFWTSSELAAKTSNYKAVSKTIVITVKAKK